MFAFANGFSSQSIFPDMYLLLFNSMFSTWVISLFSVNDVDVFPSSLDKNEDGDLTKLKAYDPAGLRAFIPKMYYYG